MTYEAVVQKINDLFKRNDALEAAQKDAYEAGDHVAIDFYSCEIAGNITQANGLGELIEIHGLRPPSSGIPGGADV